MKYPHFWKNLVVFLGVSMVLALAFVPKVEAIEKGQSDLWIQGKKFPNSVVEGTTVRIDHALRVASKVGYTGFTELLQYVVPSPDQEEAGSCLYMSLTGITEWWLAKLNPKLSRDPGGPLDLSERYMMNIGALDEFTKGVNNWKTDSIFIYNNSGHSLLNSVYPFTKGWTTYDSNEGYVEASPNSEDAEYGTEYNWINQIPINGFGQVTLPRFGREVLFADPASNQWNIGVMPKDIVVRVQSALLKRKAPVQVLYNHLGYWHSAIIVGFDDERSTQNCPFIKEFNDYLREDTAEITNKLKTATDPGERKQLEKKLNLLKTNSEKLEKSYHADGGCSPKGMFYVRDSIYQDTKMPLYDYGTSDSSDDRPYGPTVILREYEWLKYLANHAIQIYVK